MDTSIFEKLEKKNEEYKKETTHVGRKWVEIPVEELRKFTSLADGAEFGDAQARVAGKRIRALTERNYGIRSLNNKYYIVPANRNVPKFTDSQYASSEDMEEYEEPSLEAVNQ